MAYQSIFKNKITPSNTQPAKTTGYKSILSKQTPITNTNTTSTFTPRAGEKIGDIVNRTLSGGGVYKIKVGDPAWKAPNSHTTYGGVDTKTGYERADIVPTSLSGVNASSSNITLEKNLSAFDNGTDKTYRTATDKYLMEELTPQLKSGQISLREAQVKAVSYLQNKQMGLDSSNINLGGKAGEIADNIVNFFKGLQQTKQPEISTKDLAKKIAIPQSEQGKQTLKSGKPSVFQPAEFYNNQMIPSKLNLPADNWISKTINAVYNIPSEAKANLASKLSELAATQPKLNSVIQEPVLNTPSDRVGGVVKTGFATLGLIPQWLAFGIAVESAKNLPGKWSNPLTYPTGAVKLVATGLDMGIQKLGEFGSTQSGKDFDVVADEFNLSQQTRDTWKPIIQSGFALLAQLYGAKKVADISGTAFSSLKETIKNRAEEVKVKNGVAEEITPEVFQQVFEDTKSKLDNQNHQQNLDKLIKDPTPENLQKAIDSKPEQKLLPEKTTPEPIKQGEGFIMSDKINKENLVLSKATQDYRTSLKNYNDKPTPATLLKVKNNKAKLESLNNGQPAETSKISNRVEPKTSLVHLPKQEILTSTPDKTFTPKLTQSNRQKAIDLGVKESEFKNLPEVEKINLQEQFNKAKDYIDKNNEKAKEILKGNEPLPEGINATQFLAAAEKYLKENPNKDLAFEIANSELARAASLAGQEVVSAKLREPDSFTAKIIELKKAREPKTKDIGKKRATAKKSLKEEMNKVNLSKEDLSWDKFLEKITC